MIELCLKISRLAVAVVALTACLLHTTHAQENTQPAENTATAEQSTTDTANEPAGTSYPGEQLWLKLQKGGITIVFLGLLSVAGLTFTIERFVNLKRSAIMPNGLFPKVEEAWKKQDYERAEKISKESDSTAGRILETYVHFREYPPSEISPIVGDIASRELKRHLQRAYPMAVVGAVAPLLGLMGTVFGMIESFETVAIAGSLGDASILADGISKALVTTAAGLVIAIPFLLLYHFFKTKTTLYAVDLEEAVNEFTKRNFLKKSIQSPVKEAN